MSYHQSEGIPLFKPTVWTCQPWACHPRVRKAVRNGKELANQLPDDSMRQRSPRLPRLSVANEEWDRSQDNGHAAGHCGKFSHLTCGERSLISVWLSLFFQRLLQNGDLWGVSHSVMNVERDRWRPSSSSLAMWNEGRRGGTEKKKKKNRLFFLCLKWCLQVSAVKETLHRQYVRRAGHTGVFPPGNNLQHHCFLIWRIMNNTVDPICSFSQRRTFLVLSALWIYWHYREFGEI